jgi:hypothetical protein
VLIANMGRWITSAPFLGGLYMFRLIRLPILLGLAFLAGVIYEKQNARTLCEAAQGRYQNGLCER